MAHTRTLALLGLLAAASPAALAQGGVTRFCTPGAHGALISATGSASLSANGGSGDLVLHATGLPPGAMGVFLQGNQALPPTPFGQGFLCVGGSPQVWRLAVASTGPSGTSASHAVDHQAPPDPAAQVTPGSTWSYQFWFRSGAAADLTDAIAIQYVPPVPHEPVTEIYATAKSGHPLAQTPGGGAFVLEDAAALAAFWSAHTSGTTPPPPPPQVDFTQETAIAVLAGRRLTTGFHLEVRRVALSVTTLHVTTLEHQPDASCGVFFAETCPTRIVTVPRVEAPVLGGWVAVQRTYSCP